MRTRNPSFGRARDVALGRIGPNRAGSSGITVTDAQGNEVSPVTTLRVPWVIALADDEAQIGSEVGGTYTNNSGAALNIGDVVVVVGTTVTTTTTAQDTRPLGVVVVGADDGDDVGIVTAGRVELVNVTASVTADYYLETSTTGKKATQNATRRAGSFGVILAAGTSPSALLFGIPDTTGTGAGTGGLTHAQSAAAHAVALRTYR